MERLYFVGKTVQGYRYDYNSWGQSLAESETYPAVGNRFKYESNWMALKDSGGELVLSPSRLYNGTLGRFIQRDPLSVLRKRKKLGFYEQSIFAREIRGNLEDKKHPGQYVAFNNNPTNKLDPWGLTWLPNPLYYTNQADAYESSEQGFLRWYVNNLYSNPRIDLSSINTSQLFRTINQEVAARQSYEWELAVKKVELAQNWLALAKRQEPQNRKLHEGFYPDGKLIHYEWMLALAGTDNRGKLAGEAFQRIYYPQYRRATETTAFQWEVVDQHVKSGRIAGFGGVGQDFGLGGGINVDDGSIPWDQITAQGGPIVGVGCLPIETVAGGWGIIAKPCADDFKKEADCQGEKPSSPGYHPDDILDFINKGILGEKNGLFIQCFTPYNLWEKQIKKTPYIPPSRPNERKKIVANMEYELNSYLQAACAGICKFAFFVDEDGKKQKCELPLWERLYTEWKFNKANLNSPEDYVFVGVIGRCECHLHI